jgi:hypothetical protein
MYLEQVRDDIIKGLNKDFKMNITNNEEKALRELLYDDSIVIRSSDKSSGVVIMNRSDYETKVYDELNDNGAYKEIKEHLTTKLKTKLRKMSKVCIKEMLLRKK